MKTLMELLAETPAVEIEIAGQKFSVPKITAFEQLVLEQIYPYPQAPIREKRNKRGGYDPATPDTQDPDYIKAGNAWHLHNELCAVAVAMGSSRLGIKERWPECSAETAKNASVVKQVKDFIEAAIPLVGRLPWNDIAAAAKLIRGVEVDRLKVAEGNSSSGAGTVQTPRTDGDPQASAPIS